MLEEKTMDKTIFVLLDACQYEAASKYLGYLEHMIDYNKGAKYKVLGELPSLSKPMYATLFTGLPVCEHGVTCNEVGGVLPYDSVFSLCRKAGGRTAAISYSWMSELYSRAPYVSETGYSWIRRAPSSMACTIGMTTIRILMSSQKENAFAKLLIRILCCITPWLWMSGDT